LDVADVVQVQQWTLLNAGPTLPLPHLGDVFQDSVDSLSGKMKNEKGVEVPHENCFVGFDAILKK
jgi:myo-inositol 2-dehydrogenase / D-chiro-inositol 1-dehydrogenase